MVNSIVNGPGVYPWKGKWMPTILIDGESLAIPIECDTCHETKALARAIIETVNKFKNPVSQLQK